MLSSARRATRPQTCLGLRAPLSRDPLTPPIGGVEVVASEGDAAAEEAKSPAERAMMKARRERTATTREDVVAAGAVATAVARATSTASLAATARRASAVTLARNSRAATSPTTLVVAVVVDAEDIGAVAAVATVDAAVDSVEAAVVAVSVVAEDSAVVVEDLAALAVDVAAVGRAWERRQERAAHKCLLTEIIEAQTVAAKSLCLLIST